MPKTNTCWFCDEPVGAKSAKCGVSFCGQPQNVKCEIHGGFVNIKAKLDGQIRGDTIPHEDGWFFCHKCEKNSPKLARKPTVAEYVGLVKQYASTDNLDKAKAALKRAGLTHPKAPELQAAGKEIQKSKVRQIVVAGEWLLGRGDFRQAREQFKKALDWDKNNRAAKKGLQEANQQESTELAQQANTARETRRWPQAMQLFEKALEADPNNRDVKNKLTEIRKFDNRRQELEKAGAKANTDKQYNRAKSTLRDLKRHDPKNPILKDEAALDEKIDQANQLVKEFQKLIKAQVQPLAADREQALLDYWEEHGALLGQYDHPDRAAFKKRAQAAKERIDLAGKLARGVEAEASREVVAIWGKANKLLKEFEPVRKLFPQIKAANALVKAVRQIQAAAEKEAEETLHEIWNTTAELPGSRMALEEQAGGMSIEDRCRQASQRVEIVGKIRDLIDQQAAKAADSGFLQREPEEAIIAEHDKHSDLLTNSRFAEEGLGNRVREARSRVDQANNLTRTIEAEADRETTGIWGETNGILENYEPVRVLRPKIEAAQQRVKAVEVIKTAAEKEGDEDIQKTWEASPGLHDSRIARKEKINGLSITDRCVLAKRRIEGVEKIKALIQQQDVAVKSGGPIAEQVEKEILSQQETYATDFKDSRYAEKSIGARVEEARERIRYANCVAKAVQAEADRDVTKIWSQANGLLKNHEPIRALYPRIKAADARVRAVDQIQAVAKNEAEEQIHQAWNSVPDLPDSRIALEEKVDGQSIEARCRLASQRLEAVAKIQSLLKQQETSTPAGPVIHWKIVEQIVKTRKASESILEKSTFAQNRLGQPYAEAETLYAAVQNMNAAVKAQDWMAIASIWREQSSLQRLDDYQGKWHDYFTKITSAMEALERFVSQYLKNPMDDDALVQAWQRDRSPMDRLCSQPEERLKGKSPAAIMEAVQARWSVKKSITSELSRDAPAIDYLKIRETWDERLCAWHESFKALLPYIREAVAKGEAIEMIKQSLAAGQIHEVRRVWWENEDWMSNLNLLRDYYKLITQSIITSVFGTEQSPIAEEKIGKITPAIGGMNIHWKWLDEEVPECYVAVDFGQSPKLPEVLVPTNTSQLINYEMYYANAGCLLSVGPDGRFPHVGVWPVLKICGKKIPIGAGGQPQGTEPYLAFRQARLQAAFEPGFMPSTQKLSLQSLSGKFDVPDLMIVYSADGTPDRTSEVVLRIDRFQIKSKTEFNFKPPGQGELKILTRDPADEDWLLIYYTD